MVRDIGLYSSPPIGRKLTLLDKVWIGCFFNFCCISNLNIAKTQIIYMIFKSTIIAVFVNELKRTFSAGGRVSRRQFGLSIFAVFNLILLIGNIIPIFQGSHVSMQILEVAAFFFLVLPSLLLFIFLFTLIIRRIHDLGHSAWFILWLFVPVVSIVLYLYLFFTKGEITNNKYGVIPINHELTLLDKIWLYFWPLYILFALIILQFL